MQFSQYSSAIVPRDALTDVTKHITLVSEATGYGMVVGLSILFALIIIAAVRVQRLYLNEDSDKSEMFMVILIKCNSKDCIFSGKDI